MSYFNAFSWYAKRKYWFKMNRVNNLKNNATSLISTPIWSIQLSNVQNYKQNFFLLLHRAFWYM